MLVSRNNGMLGWTKHFSFINYILFLDSNFEAAIPHFLHTHAFLDAHTFRHEIVCK